MAHPTLRGRLLVAAPDLHDPNFYHTVVFLLEHDERGALGVILNRPTDIQATDMFPEWQHRISDPPVIFQGGPVQPDAYIGLARLNSDVTPDHWIPIIDSVGLLSIQDEAKTDDLEISAFRLYSGYAGWGGEQLESEIDAGGWFTLPGAPQDVFESQPANLWFRLLRDHQGQWPWRVRPPADPTRN